MQLLTDEDRATLPGVYATEGQGEAAVCRLRLFVPGTYWQWFPVEFDGEDLFFGLVAGHDVEAGYFSLAEMEAYGAARRDETWTPLTLAEVRAQLARERGG